MRVIYPFPIFTMYSNTANPTFADFSLRKQKMTRTAAFLEHVNDTVDFSFTEEWHEQLHPSRRGRPPFDAGVMFRVILLQLWFGLSDAEAEEHIYDRQSFQQFLGITTDTDVPDETTICRFRALLQKHKLEEAFFVEVYRQLEEHGVKIRRGKIVDATICETPKGRKRKDGTTTRDDDAGFTKKNGRGYHGYKGHIATDTKGKFIEERVISSASPHDSQFFDELVDDSDQAAFADSAYINTERKQKYREDGKLYGIVERATRNHPLTSSQKKRNRKLSTVRCRVEHPFAEIKKRMKFWLRYRGQRKNEWQFTMVCAAYNLKRLVGEYHPAQKQAVIWRPPVLRRVTVSGEC